MNLLRILPSVSLGSGLATTIEPRWERLQSLMPIFLFALCFTVLLRTLCPTVYALDSAELATGAAILGIVHAPGYPLYVMIAHLFTLLPIGDVGFRANLFSAVCLALTAPVLFSLLYKLTEIRWIAVTATLAFIWSYYVWSSGTIAEIYAPQVLTLALCGWSLVWMYQDYISAGRVSTRSALFTAGLYGVAVAMAPTSMLFAPGLALAFLLMRVPWRMSLAAGSLAAVIVAVTLLYFPLRGSAYPDFNKIGYYDSLGYFHNFDFRTPQGILRALSAEQFRYLFFRYGYVPNADQLMSVLSWLWRSYLGFGVVLGLIGAIHLFRQRRGLLMGLTGLALPYTYFFTCYGAVDRDTMFGPTYLAWAVLLAFGLKTLFRDAPYFLRLSVTVGLPLIALAANFSPVDRSTDISVRTHAEDVLQSLPPGAVVAGYWADITPLQYLQFVENQRPDVEIYDLFMFRPRNFRSYVERLSESGRRPIILLNSAILSLPNTTDYRISISPILTYLPGDSRQFLTVTLINRVSG